MSNNAPVLVADALGKVYAEGDLRVDVFCDVSLELRAGERVAIVGNSGSGKSTLMHLLGGLDSPPRGSVSVAGERLSELGPAARGRLRNRHLGFVYQFHHLLPEFTAVENVAMPLLIRGDRPASAQQAAIDMLTRVGLGERTRHKPTELSGGERQRAAIARALVTKPSDVVADEPTGNLDEETSAVVYDQMLELNRELNTTFLVVTHDLRLAQRMDRTLQLVHGTLTPATSVA